MKICFTMEPQKTAFGGGNQFALNLINYLKKNGHNIVFKLVDNIDIIFIMDPRILKYNKIDLQQIIKYKKNNKNTKVIHRVNDCDKPRGDIDKLDKILIDTFKICNNVVFVSEWTKNYFFNEKKISIKNFNVINNGCNRNYFYPDKNHNFNINNVRIITHHWSSNSNKGKIFYEKLDEYIKDKNISFTYIGREFPGKPKNTKVLGPYFGLELANNLRNADIYVSASQYENCPMHVIEGLSCGLPLLYHKNIGGGVEIGKRNGGEEFDTFEDFTEKLDKIVENYNLYKNKINYNSLDSQTCNKKWSSLMNNIT